MIATSDTGERLSPKMAPERIAPEAAEGSTPSAAAAGRKTGAAVKMVEMELPVAVARSAQVRKIPASTMPLPVKNPPASPASAAASPEAFMRAEKTPPARSSIRTDAVRGLAALRTAASQYRVGVLQRSAPRASETKAAAARADRSKTRWQAKRTMDAAEKSRAGRKRPKAPK